MIATLIDYFLLFIMNLAFLSIFGHSNGEGGWSIEGPIVFAPMIIAFCYLVAAEFLANATLGHALLQLKVVSMDATKPTLIQIIKRRLADIIDLYLFVGLVAVIAILRTPYRQRLGDLWAGTVMVDKSKPDIISQLGTELESTY